MSVIRIIPERLDIPIVKGATLHLPMEVKDLDGQPIDLTGATATIQFRLKENSDIVLLEVSTATGEITGMNADGEIRVIIPAETTAAFQFRAAVWELAVTFPATGFVAKWLAGTIRVDTGVVR